MSTSRRSRVRRVGKWIGLVVSVTLLLAGIMSFYRGVGYVWSRGSVCMVTGIMSAFTWPDPISSAFRGFEVWEVPIPDGALWPSVRESFRLPGRGGFGRGISVPLGLPLLLGGAGSAGTI